MAKDKSQTQLKLAHMNLGDDADLDKNSLGYKLRRALITYFTKKVNEKINKFSRGETMHEDDETIVKSTPEEICKGFFTRFAEFLHKNNLCLITIIKKYVYDSVLSSKDVQLIYIEDFFKAIREYGFKYSQEEKKDVTQFFSMSSINGSFLLELIEKLLMNLGIPKGLPPCTKAMDYEKLDMKSFRIINRIIIFMKQNNIKDFTSLMTDKKVIEIVDSNGSAKNIEYVTASEFNSLL